MIFNYMSRARLTNGILSFMERFGSREIERNSRACLGATANVGLLVTGYTNLFAEELNGLAYP